MDSNILQILQCKRQIQDSFLLKFACLKLAACSCRQPFMPGIVLCGWYARGIALSDVQTGNFDEVVPTWNRSLHELKD